EYDDKLEGGEGSLNYYSDAMGRKIPDTSYNYQQPRDGLHLKTTIDLDVQTIIVRELDLEEMKYQHDGAFAIAVNPKTGGIIAMSHHHNVDTASYEPAADEIFDRNLPI